MADVATSSPAASGTVDAGAQLPKDKAAAPSRPERPDEETFKANLAKAEKELRAAEERMKQIKARLDVARPNNKDSPTAKRQQELRNELQAIRQQQQSSKSSRTQVMDRIKRLDEQLKSRINEQKTARSKVQYKSVDEIQKEIDHLQKQVDSGTMRLVDEKKALADISQLNRQKKSFAGFDDAQKGIDDVKNQIADLRAQLDDPESKALGERYTQITTELDKIKAEQDEAYKDLNALRDERTKAHEDQQKKYFAVKEIKDQYFQARRAAREYEVEARRVREEKRRLENEAYHRGRRQEAAKAKLEEASAPAYQDEIRTCQRLIAYFDPASAPKEATSEPSKFAATAQRTVDDSGIKGTRLPRKGEEDDNYFVGGGGKKKKGGRQQQQQSNGTSPTPAASAESKFNLDSGTLDSLGRIGVDPPYSQQAVPAVVEKLREKLDFWKGDQDRKTKENIARARAEIEKLEAEAEAAETKATSGSSGATTDNAKKVAQQQQQVNGSANADTELTHEKDAVEDAAREVKDAKIEDENTEEGDGQRDEE